MEELSEGVIKSVLRGVGFVVRVLIWAVFELFLWIVGWYIGWPLCRVITLGYLPAQSINEHSQTSEPTHAMVSLVGILGLFAAAIFIAQLVGMG